MSSRTWSLGGAVALSAVISACGGDAARVVERETESSSPGAGASSAGGDESAAPAGGSSSDGGAGGAPADGSGEGGSVDAFEGGEAAAGGGDAMAGDGPGGDPPLTIACEPGGPGACQNDVDCEALSSGSAAEDAQGCAPCLLMADQVACFEACLGDSVGLSASCSSCFAELVSCGVQFCAASCLVDVTSEACVTCRADNCSESFEACAGVPAL